MRFDLERYKPELARLCSLYGVHRLELVGSAARDDFDPDRSDVDFLVDYRPELPINAFDRYFALKEALEALFERKVDLINRKALTNPYVARTMLRDRVPAYESP